MFKIIDKDVKQIIEELDTLKQEGIEFALVYQYESLTYSKIEDLKINWDNLIEARLFGENREIHIIKEQNCFSAVEVIDTAEENHLKTTYLLQKNSGFSKLQVKKYIDYDCDGQSYIQYVRPCRVW